LRTEILSPQALVAANDRIPIVQRAQQRVGARCVHTDFDVVAKAIAQENAEEVFYVSVHDETSEAALGVYGVEIADDLQRGWLRGPYVDTPHLARFGDIANTSLAALLAHAGSRARTWDAFVEATHIAAIDWFRARGFEERKRNFVYSVEAADAKFAAPSGVTILEPSMIDDVVALATSSFPGGYLTRAEFAAPASDEAVTFVCRDGDELLGYAYASYEPSATEAQLDNLAVAASARHRGIGRALLQRALHWAFAERAAPRMALVTTEDNVNAQSLYESAGFKLTVDGLHFRLET
jgi:ribosomal protein S18 acetylase RimI-like enzyme